MAEIDIPRAVGVIASRAVSVVVATLLLSLTAPHDLHAACNVIPAAQPKGAYLSTEGGILNRTATPGTRVTVFADHCGGTLFKTDQATKIEMIVVHDFGPPVGEVVVASQVAPAREFPDSCATSNVCENVSFEVPDTTGASTPQGLAGPTRLRISNEGFTADPSDDELVAEIDTLFLPSSPCPPSLKAEPVFGHFVLLPNPNPFRSDPAGPTPPEHELLAALDADGNLLIPFDYAADLQNTPLPVATLLTGESNTKAFEAANPADPDTIGRKIGKLGRRDRSRQVRVFSLDGAALPPMMHVGSTGAVFGLIDAPSSVIRVARRRVTNPSAPALFDLEDSPSYPGGPARLTYTASEEHKTAVPLVGLQSNAQTIAYARDEAYEGEMLNGDTDTNDLVPEVVDIESGEPNLTGFAAASVPVGNLLRPLLEIDGPAVTFLEPVYDSTGTMIESYRHRFYWNTGAEVAGSPARPASAVSKIAGAPIATSGPTTGTTVPFTAFYLSPAGAAPYHDKLGAVVGAGGTVATGKPPVIKAATAGGHAALLVPEAITGDRNGDLDAFDTVVHFYGFPDGNECPVISLGVGATDVAISEDILVAAVSERQNPTIPGNGDGDSHDDVVWIWSISDLVTACQATPPLFTLAKRKIGYAAESIAAWGKRAVFLAAEYEQNSTGATLCGPTVPAGGCDLNQDQDPNDRVLMVVHANGNVASSEKAAVDYELGNGFIAFRVSEADDGNQDHNDDADTNDAVMHAYFPNCIPSMQIQNSKWSALACTFAACDDRHPYRIAGRLIWFITDDHQPGPMAVAVAEAHKCILRLKFPLPGLFPAAPVVLPYSVTQITPPFPKNVLGASVLFQPMTAARLDPAGGDGPDSFVTRLGVAGDVDGDSILDFMDNCEEFPNPDLLDVDRDGLGDRYCDPSPAACPKRPLRSSKCVGPSEEVEGSLCAEDGPEGLRYAWNWQLDAAHAELPDTGDPVRELPHYSLCIYGGNDGTLIESAVLPWDECGDPPCWEGERDKGFVYRGDRELDGTLERLVLPSRTARTPQIHARGVVEEARLMAAELGPKNVVQLIARDRGQRTACWASTNRPVLGIAGCPDPLSPTGPMP